MDALDDYYEVLGLQGDATPDEVRRAYRDLAKVWHPDRFPADLPLRLKAEEKLRAINAAYQAIREAQASSASPVLEEPGPRESEDRSGSGGHGAYDPPRPRPVSPDDRDQNASRSAPRPTIARRSRAWDRSLSFRLRAWLPIAAILVGLRLWSLYVDPRADTFDPLEEPGFTQATRESSSGIALDMGRTQEGNWQVTLAVPGQEKGHPYKLEIPGSLRFEAAAAKRMPAALSGGWMPSQTVSDPRSKLARPEPAAPGYFGIGSTDADVRGTQGAPTVVVGNIWAYGRSSVRFETGRVAGYVNAGGNLRLPPGSDRKPPDVRQFSTGSSEDEVLAAQGLPDRVGETTWSYGPSWVQFRDRRVVGYSNVSGNLNVR